MEPCFYMAFTFDCGTPVENSENRGGGGRRSLKSVICEVKYRVESEMTSLSDGGFQKIAAPDVTNSP